MSSPSVYPGSPSVPSPLSQGPSAGVPGSQLPNGSFSPKDLRRIPPPPSPGSTTLPKPPSVKAPFFPGGRFLGPAGAALDVANALPGAIDDLKDFGDIGQCLTGNVEACRRSNDHARRKGLPPPFPSKDLPPELDPTRRPLPPSNQNLGIPGQGYRVKWNGTNDRLLTAPFSPGFTAVPNSYPEEPKTAYYNWVTAQGAYQSHVSVTRGTPATVTYALITNPNDTQQWDPDPASPSLPNLATPVVLPPSLDPKPLPQGVPGLKPNRAPSPTQQPQLEPADNPTKTPEPSPISPADPSPAPNRNPSPSNNPSPSPSPKPSPGGGGGGGGSPSNPSTPDGYPRPPATPPTAPPRPSPDRCNDPCIQKIQDTLDQTDNSALQDLIYQLRDMLEQLLNQQPGNGGDNENPEPMNITVPVVSCMDGQPIITETSISCLPDDESHVTMLFNVLAAIKSAQCAGSDDKVLKRIYRILGGDRWFASESAENPEIQLGEDDIKGSGGTQAYPQGKVPIKSLIELDLWHGQTFYNRLGLKNFPQSLPETLLSYSDGQEIRVHSPVDYFSWFIQQFDALAGHFPIEIEIEDSDPLQEGKQYKKIELPNISEALSELVGMGISTATNADLSINFLMRLAAEVVATKNAALIAQDYAKGNAMFLGYKGNPVQRKIPYSFNIQNLNDFAQLLSESEGYIMGWEENDKESVVGYLQKLVFAAGIIKGSLFRNKHQISQLEKELVSMLDTADKEGDVNWNKFIQMINDPSNPFNFGDVNPQPKVDKEPNPDV